MGLHSQKYQDQILESGVRPPFDSLDGQNMVLRDDIARTHFTRIIVEYKKSTEHCLSFTAELVVRLETYRPRVGQALLMCLKPGTSRIKIIVNFARLNCRSGTGFHVLDACTELI